MTVLEQLERADSLVVELTTAPATATLRNQLAVVREQIEALEADYAKLKNAYTVLKNTTEYEIAQLKEAYARLDSEKHQIDEKLAGLMAGAPKPLGELSPETTRILQAIFRHDGPVSEELIAFHCDLGANLVRYHFGVLTERCFIRWNQSEDAVGNSEYCITQEGMAYLVDRHLID